MRLSFLFPLATAWDIALFDTGMRRGGDTPGHDINTDTDPEEIKA